MPVLKISFHPPPPVRGGTGRGGGTFVRTSSCILPCPERGGGCVRIVPRHQVCSFEGGPGVLVVRVRVCGFRGGREGGLTLSTVAKKPKNAFVGLLLNLQKRLLPGSPLDDPDVIDKEIFLIPFFTGNFFENFEFFELVYQIIGWLVTDAKR
jgi:hypothetical protein